MPFKLNWENGKGRGGGRETKNRPPLGWSSRKGVNEAVCSCLPTAEQDRTNPIYVLSQSSIASPLVSWRQVQDFGTLLRMCVHPSLCKLGRWRASQLYITG